MDQAVFEVNLWTDAGAREKQANFIYHFSKQELQRAAQEEKKGKDGTAEKTI